MHPYAVGLLVKTAIALALFLLLAFPLLALGSQTLMRPKPKMKGRHIAEVWLEWDICRGSTMYRQRFPSRWAAHMSAKLHAMILDFCLPKYYCVEGRDGRPHWERYEMGISFGVRSLSASEVPSVIWTTVMPGHDTHEGEHRDAHPLIQKMNALQGSLDGFQI